MAIGKLLEEEVAIAEARKTGNTRWSFEVCSDTIKRFRQNDSHNSY